MQWRIIVEDSEGVKTLGTQPVRVAALNWDIAEQVIELGATPVAVPDIAGYTDWVVQPAIPEGGGILAPRTEPNFSASKKLNPDVILIASPQKDLSGATFWNCARALLPNVQWTNTTQRLLSRTSRR